MTDGTGASRRFRAVPGLVVAAGTVGVTGLTLAWAAQAAAGSAPPSATPPPATTASPEPARLAVERAEVSALEQQVVVLRQTFGRLAARRDAGAPVSTGGAPPPAGRPVAAAAPAPVARPAPAPAPGPPPTHTTTGASGAVRP